MIVLGWSNLLVGGVGTMLWLLWIGCLVYGSMHPHLEGVGFLIGAGISGGLLAAPAPLTFYAGLQSLRGSPRGARLNVYMVGPWNLVLAALFCVSTVWLHTHMLIPALTAAVYGVSVILVARQCVPSLR